MSSFISYFWYQSGTDLGRRETGVSRWKVWEALLENGYGTLLQLPTWSSALPYVLSTEQPYQREKSRGREAAVRSYDRGQRDPRKDKIRGGWQGEKDSKWWVGHWNPKGKLLPNKISREEKTTEKKNELHPTRFLPEEWGAFAFLRKDWTPTQYHQPPLNFSVRKTREPTRRKNPTAGGSSVV